MRSGLLPGMFSALRSADSVVICQLLTSDARACGGVGAFLGDSVDLYPEIHDWWSRRVLPALRRHERVCYTAVESDRIVGVCIGKPSARSSKLCTLRVDTSVQGCGVGSRLIGRLFDHVAAFGGKRMHFTISEAVERQCGSYFRGLGFSRQAWIRRPGRVAGDEWVYARSSTERHGGLHGVIGG